MTEQIYTQQQRKIVRMPDLTAPDAGELTIKEETAIHEGRNVVLFSAPGRVGIYVDAIDLISGAVTHEQAYSAVLNGSAIGQPHLTLQ